MVEKGDKIVVKVDRISQSGNPIATFIDGNVLFDENSTKKNMHVPDGEVDDIVEITVVQVSPYVIGLQFDSDEEYEEYKEIQQRKRREKQLLKNKNGTKKKVGKKKRNVNTKNKVTGNKSPFSSRRQKSAMEQLNKHL